MRWNGTRDLQKNQEKRLIDESPKIVKCDVFDGVFRVTSSVNGDGVSM